MKFADYIVAMNDLRVFCPHHLSNIVWAYAIAGESHPWFFKHLADHIVAQGDLNGLKPQNDSTLFGRTQLQASHTHFSFKSWPMKQSQGGMISMLKAFPICFGRTL